MRFCFIKPPVCGYLLWKPEGANTMGQAVIVSGRGCGVGIRCGIYQRRLQAGTVVDTGGEPGWCVGSTVTTRGVDVNAGRSCGVKARLEPRDHETGGQALSPSSRQTKSRARIPVA